jgi:hypothetical protein
MWQLDAAPYGAHNMHEGIFLSPFLFILVYCNFFWGSPYFFHLYFSDSAIIFQGYKKKFFKLISLSACHTS